MPNVAKAKLSADMAGAMKIAGSDTALVPVSFQLESWFAMIPPAWNTCILSREDQTLNSDKHISSSPRDKVMITQILRLLFTIKYV